MLKDCDSSLVLVVLELLVMEMLILSLVGSEYLRTSRQHFVAKQKLLLSD